MNIEFWKAALIRAARTFLQVILAVWTAGQLITEVDWRFLLLSAFSSAVYSLLTSILSGLPEVNLTETLYALDNEPFDEEEEDMEDIYDEIGIPETEEEEDGEDNGTSLN